LILAALALPATHSRGRYPDWRTLVTQRPLFPEQSGAVFSPCRTWRYELWRRWDDSRQACVFIGLNPSTADETANDPTIRRCIDFAKRWDCGALVMLNLYAFRATDPRDMLKATDPVGPENDAALRRCTERAGTIVAAWGTNADPVRAELACLLINRPIMCLRLTKEGCPQHPLYIPADTKPIAYWMPPELRRDRAV
jgi:hypothetical protein